MHGTDASGPTTVMRSVSKLPTIRMLAQLLNLRLSPAALADEAGLNDLDGAAQAAIQEDPDPQLRIHLTQIRPDVNMGNLLKTTVSSQLFTAIDPPWALTRALQMANPRPIFPLAPDRFLSAR